MQKVIGVENYFGEMEGKAYNGYRLYVATDKLNPNYSKLLAGYKVETIKVPTIVFSNYNIKPEDTYQKEIAYSYNKWQQVDMIQIIK